MDGAGVRLIRMIGGPGLDMLDPFLMLDRFDSDNPDDYIAGFPDHPHRGFETVTYLVAGSLRHRDSTGREGLITPGGVQWMTAGRGIIHSEMPMQVEGRLSGFQLWINLPAREKMCAPDYQEFDRDALPVYREPGVEARIISGQWYDVRGPIPEKATRPVFFDVTLDPASAVEIPLSAEANGFVCPVSGAVSVGPDAVKVAPDELAVLSPGERLNLRSGDDGARFLLIAALPLGEPVARAGPFVMNTEAELLRAYRDFQRGELA